MCGPKKAARIRRFIAAAAREHGLNRFLTLTLDPKRLEPGADHVAYLRDTWRKFRVYLKRQHGQTVTFIAVMEEHKSGIPHLHVLVDRYIHQKWISKAWSALGGGRIVHIERVKDLGAIGWYLGKYLTKEMLLSARRGVRRYTTSRNIHLGPKRGEGGWTRAPAGMSELRRAAGDRATAVVEDALGATRYFETEQPLRRMKALGGRVLMSPPLPAYVNPAERDGVATWEEIMATFLGLKEESRLLAQSQGKVPAGTEGASPESEKRNGEGSGADASGSREGDCGAEPGECE
jgi:cytosine/adenosine deaminase-related metal-dependent hydrolase